MVERFLMITPESIIENSQTMVQNRILTLLNKPRPNRFFCCLRFYERKPVKIGGSIHFLNNKNLIAIFQFIIQRNHLAIDLCLRTMMTQAIRKSVSEIKGCSSLRKLHYTSIQSHHKQPIRKEVHGFLVCFLFVK